MKSILRIELDDEDIRTILVNHLRSTYPQMVPTHLLRFIVSEGYNGEMGGPAVPDKVRAYVELEA